MLYDYFSDVGYIGLFAFFLLSVVLIGLAVWVIIPVIRILRTNKTKTKTHSVELFVRVFVLMVLSVFGFFSSSHLVRVATYYYEYTANLYDVATGSLNDVDYVESGGRGEYYSVSFKVDDLDFHDTNISIDKDAVDMIRSAEGQNVSVCYKNENGEKFIYKMSVVAFD